MLTPQALGQDKGVLRADCHDQAGGDQQTVEVTTKAQHVKGSMMGKAGSVPSNSLLKKPIMLMGYKGFSCWTTSYSWLWLRWWKRARSSGRRGCWVCPSRQSPSASSSWSP